MIEDALSLCSKKDRAETANRFSTTKTCSFLPTNHTNLHERHAGLCALNSVSFVTSCSKQNRKYRAHAQSIEQEEAEKTVIDDDRSYWRSLAV